jgi:hypothetical protein
MDLRRLIRRTLKMKRGQKVLPLAVGRGFKFRCDFGRALAVSKLEEVVPAGVDVESNRLGWVYVTDHR